MRILIFHGYLLGGTGSNVYNARLAAALVDLGHDVHLLCQDRHPERQRFAGAAGDWDGGELRIRPLERPRRDPLDAAAAAREVADTRARGNCTLYRPNIGGLLPVYVADRYEGVQARTFARCSAAEIAHYIDANVAAVAEVRARADAQLALANHVVMGPLILARALQGRVRYAVKVHGSALEYTVKEHPERFLGPALEGLAGASAILVGSRHTAESLWRALADPQLERRTRLGPPGVDVERFASREPARAREGLRALTVRLQATAAAVTARTDAGVPVPAVSRPELRTGPGGQAQEPGERDAFARDDLGAALALAGVDARRDRLVAFVGKLILNKGLDLLLAAWPLVLERVPAAKLVVVGFGADREPLQRLHGALAAGDLDAARELASPYARAFLRDLPVGERGRCERYFAGARMLAERAVFTGRLDHEELAELLPACEALVVPSTFPEAFGMVAAEAAACGVLPISAAHSGLAEVSDVLARAVPEQVAPLLSFPLDEACVRGLAERIVAWLELDPALRERARAGLVATVRKRWSWHGVARGVIAAARGELDALAMP